MRAQVAHGIVPAGRIHSGKPYAATTLYQKQRAAERGEAQVRVALATAAVLAEIPTYQEWCAVVAPAIQDSPEASRPRLIVNGVEITLAHLREAFPEWYRLAIKYEWRLAEERYEVERLHANRERHRAEASR